MTSGHNNKHNPSYVQHRDFNHYDRVSANADVVVIGTCISYAGVNWNLSAGLHKHETAGPTAASLNAV